MYLYMYIYHFWFVITDLQIFGFISLSLVVISTAIFILQTLPELENDKQYPIAYAALQITDSIVMVFFTLEYLLRLVCSPRKLNFFIKYYILHRTSSLDSIHIRKQFLFSLFKTKSIAPNLLHLLLFIYSLLSLIMFLAFICLYCEFLTVG